MKCMTLCVLGLCAAATVVQGRTQAGDNEKDKASPTAGEAKRILEKAEAALKKVRLVRYKGRYLGTGWVTEFVATVEGSVLLGEPSEYDVPRFRCELKLTPAKSEKTVELTAGSDGDTSYLIDTATKTVYADIDQAVLGTHARDIQRILMRTFVEKEPLADDLKAEKLELMEPTTVGGEECHQIRVTRSETQEVIWSISKKDWLPRRVARHYKNAQGETGSTQLVVIDVEADSTFTLAPFELKVPKGFSKTDEFAP